MSGPPWASQVQMWGTSGERCQVKDVCEILDVTEKHSVVRCQCLTVFLAPHFQPSVLSNSPLHGQCSCSLSSCVRHLGTMWMLPLDTEPFPCEVFPQSVFLCLPSAGSVTQPPPGCPACPPRPSGLAHMHADPQAALPGICQAAHKVGLAPGLVPAGLWPR